MRDAEHIKNQARQLKNQREELWLENERGRIAQTSTAEEVDRWQKP